MRKRIMMLILSGLIAFSMAPAGLIYAEETGADTGGAEVVLEDGTYAPGEVMVRFRSGAVKDTKISLSSAQKMENVDEGFGEAMEATDEASEAAADAKAEVQIIGKSLGEDFVIKDSIAFDEDLTVALVASEKYDTEEMIEKLSDNPDVAAVDANYYSQPQSYEYSLNDALNAYNYQTNSHQAVNKAGKNVSAFWHDPEKTVSTNAGSAWNKYQNTGREVVVAVIDSGINYNHEEFEGTLWNNPGNIGLEGEHGFCFGDNATDVMDTHGHGTHVSGIIAAAANNGKGIAGVASGVDVKLMMLSKGTASTEGLARTTYVEFGGFNYALKAKQRGVNVVAISNSWGNPGTESIFNEIVDRLGEEGIMTFFAAGNENANNDAVSYYGAGGTSQYQIVVGAVDAGGNRAGFSNYGKSGVDVFAPGVNILSASPFSVYSPNLYTPEERAEHTEFYGQFSGSTEIIPGDESAGTSPSVIPDTAGEGVKAFGAMKFVKQKRAYSREDGEEAPLSDASLEVSVEKNQGFTASDDPAVLRVTIRNAAPDEEYFLYFPYEKNEATTGSDNTKYSITAITRFQNGDASGYVNGGEVSKNAEGYYELTGGGNPESFFIDETQDGEVDQITNTGGHVSNNLLLSYDDVHPEGSEETRETGIGLLVVPGETQDTPPGYMDEPRDITIDIDSIGISKPITEEGKTSEDVFPANSSYVLMSGTSQATPAAAAAYAVITALNPPKDGQTGAEYAMENRARFLSAVTRTDELKDLCSTGGYIDLSKLDGSDPATGNPDTQLPSISDVVCNTSKETLTLKGIHLTPDLKLSYKRLAVEGAEEQALPSGKMTVNVAKDGQSITISNAKPLFGTYTEFILRDAEGAVKATGTYFTVKGQAKLPLVFSEQTSKDDAEKDIHFPERKLLTDTKGDTLYSFDPETGTVSRFDGRQFTDLKGTNLKEALYDHYLKEEVDQYGNPFDMRQIDNDMEVKLCEFTQPLYDGNMLYFFGKVTYTAPGDSEDDNEDCRHWFAQLNYTAKNPTWKLTETDALEDHRIDSYYDTAAAMKGKVYCFGRGESEDGTPCVSVAVYDAKTGKWGQGTGYPGLSLINAYTCVKDGRIWLMCGADQNKKPFKKVLSYDGSVWKSYPEIPFVGKNSEGGSPGITGGCVPLKNGFVMLDTSADGAGNVFFYSTSTGKCEPMYYAFSDSLSANHDSTSAVETKAGIYYSEQIDDPGSRSINNIYFLSATSGKYKSSFASLNKKTASLKAGKQLQLSVVSGKAVSWKSSNKKVCTVKSGKVTALKKGKAVITATLNTGVQVKCTVTVTTSPKLSKKSIKVKKGKTKTITITGKAPGVKNVYKNTKTARVISKKTATKIKVKGLKKGKTTLKIKVNGVILKLKVVVK